MSSCKDCLHVEVCKYNDGVNTWSTGDCPRFKDKSKFIELPCKVGDTVYHLLRTGAIAKRKVEKYILTSDGLCYVFDSNEIYPCTWKSVFLTIKEANMLLRRGAKTNDKL